MTRSMKSNLEATSALLVGALLAAGCGSSDRSGDTSVVGTCRDFSCPNPGMPRVTNAFPVTSSGQPLATPQEGETNATVVIKKDGAVCLEGDLVAGWVQLELGMMTVDSATGTIVDALDAEGLGVTALQFDVESPPQSGLSVQLISATLDCSPVSECQQWGFFLKGEGARDTQALFTESQTVTAPISAFYKTDSADRSWELDASALAGVALMHEGERGKFDYCVRNFKLLDSRGRVVAP